MSKSTGTLGSAQSSGGEAVTNGDPERTSESRQSLIAGIVEQASRHLEIRAALICSSPDPIEMVGWLGPIISDPKFDGGAIPQIYYRIAEFELMVRRCKSETPPSRSKH